MTATAASKRARFISILLDQKTPRTKSTSQPYHRDGSVSAIGPIGVPIAHRLHGSDMFSSQQTLTALLNSNAAATRKLNASARTLTACSKRVKALGAAPPKYRHARAAALRACDHFEVGADLVKLGLIAAQGGLGSDLLVEGASKLSDGVGSIPARELKGSSKKDQEIEDEANQLRQGS